MPALSDMLTYTAVMECYSLGEWVSPVCAHTHVHMPLAKGTLRLSLVFRQGFGSHEGAIFGAIDKNDFKFPGGPGSTRVM